MRRLTVLELMGDGSTLPKVSYAKNRVNSNGVGVSVGRVFFLGSEAFTEEECGLND